jgi:hypothetical protein
MQGERSGVNEGEERRMELHDLAEYVAEVVPGNLGVGLEVIERHSTTAGHITGGPGEWMDEWVFCTRKSHTDGRTGNHRIVLWRSAPTQGSMPLLLMIMKLVSVCVLWAGCKKAGNGHEWVSGP